MENAVQRRNVFAGGGRETQKSGKRKEVRPLKKGEEAHTRGEFRKTKDALEL